MTKQGRFLAWPGAKWRLAEWVASFIPPTPVYVEPFCGSAAVYFSLKHETTAHLNDLDGDIVNLFRVIRNHSDELSRLIDATPWSRQEFRDSVEPSDDPVESARRFLVRCWQGCNSKQGNTGWRRHAGPDESSLLPTWSQVPLRITDASTTLKRAFIENMDALELIQKMKRPDTTLYVDPPYVTGTRVGTLYRHEMTDEQHRRLLELLIEHPGPVVLSGYSSGIYTEALRGWSLETKQTQSQSSRIGGVIRQECLWLNPMAVSYQKKPSLLQEVA